MTLQRWVCGFLFSPSHHEMNVALIEKRRGPSMLIGKLNGIGGKIEPDEEPRDAMVREFEEEAGVRIPGHRWRYFAELRVRNVGTVGMFAAQATTHEAMLVRAQEDEPIMWVDVRKAPYYNIYSNLHWLLPMALARNHTFAIVNEEVVP